MYPAAQDGSSPNNFEFSPCSKLAINKVTSFCRYSDKLLQYDRQVVAIPTLNTIIEDNSRYKYSIEYGIFVEGSRISTNQKRESTVFSPLIG